MRKIITTVLLILIMTFMTFAAAGCVFLTDCDNGDVCQDVEVLTVSKDDYEIASDGTVSIRCMYRLRNTRDTQMQVRIGGYFYKEYESGFLTEQLLMADDIYTLEPGDETDITVVFTGHNGTDDTMPDRNPPEPYIVEAEDDTGS